jgi:Transposase
MVRTDAHQLRPVAGDTALVEGIKVVARAHQSLIWDRTRHVLRLRSALRELALSGCLVPGCAEPSWGPRMWRYEVVWIMQRWVGRRSRSRW